MEGKSEFTKKQISTIGFRAVFQPGAQPALHFGGGNFRELSFDDVIVLIPLWFNFFENSHRQSSLRNISENENLVLIRPVTR